MATRQRLTRRARPIRSTPTTRIARTGRTQRPKKQSLERPARRVLLATDGSKAAGAAIAFTSTMANAGVWRPEAVTVVEHLPVAIADVTLPAPAMATTVALEDGYLGAIRGQLKRLGGGDWKLRAEFGRAARRIVEIAREGNAQLIVLGLGKHGKLARLLGAETVARVSRLSDVPVLAVDASAKERPRTALVAMDFGDSSVRAAREALALLEPPGRLHLLHVRGVDVYPVTDPGWDRMYESGVEHAFGRLRKELWTKQGIEITAEFRRDHVLETILKVAGKIDADLIAVGSHSQTVVDRLLIGSTTSQLLQATHCSILVAPPQPST